MPKNGTGEHRYHALFRQTDIVDMASNLQFHSSSTTAPIDCILQLHTPDPNITDTDSTVPVSSIPVIEQQVRVSYMPNLLARNGPYQEPDSELLALLNYNFRLQPHLHHAIAKLHAGAIIKDKALLFELTAEAYIMGKASDIHAEANLKSLPTPSTATYGTVSIGIYEEADGKAMKRKLKVGAAYWIVLITMSAHIQSDPTTSSDIGPETSALPCQVNPHIARIFYRSAAVEQFPKWSMACPLPHLINH